MSIFLEKSKNSLLRAKVLACNGTNRMAKSCVNFYTVFEDNKYLIVHCRNFNRLSFKPTGLPVVWPLVLDAEARVRDSNSIRNNFGYK